MVKQEKPKQEKLTDEAMLDLCQDVKDNLNRSKTLKELAAGKKVAEDLVRKVARGLRKQGIEIPRRSNAVDFKAIAAKLS